MYFHLLVQCFFDIFSNLESREQLDPLSEVDLFCLHWMYVPRVNHCHQQFTQSWNNHPLSTERNWTPNQLFVERILSQRHQQPSLQISFNTTEFCWYSLQLISCMWLIEAETSVGDTHALQHKTLMMVQHNIYRLWMWLALTLSKTAFCACRVYHLVLKCVFILSNFCYTNLDMQLPMLLEYHLFSVCMDWMYSYILYPILSQQCT